MPSSQAILRHVSWAAIGSWGGKAATLAIFILLARLLPPEAIGAVALIASYLALLQLLGEIGLAEYLVQKGEHDPEQEHTVFWAQLIASCLVAGALVAAAPLVARTLSSSVPGQALVQTMSVVLPLLAAGRVPEALMRKSLAFKQLAYRNLIAALVGGVAGIACALAGGGVWSLVVKYVVETLTALIALMIAARWYPRPLFSFRALREPFRYGFAVLGARAIAVIHSRLDTLVVGGMLGSAPLGYYAVAQKLFQVVADLFNAISSSVAVPLLAKARSDTSSLRSVFGQLVRGSSLLSMAAFAALIGAAPRLIDFVFGANWAASAFALQWLCVGGFLTGPLWFNGGAMMAAGRAGTWMMVVAGYALCGAIVLPIGALAGGMTGVAAATAVRSLMVAPVSCYYTLSVVATTPREYIRMWAPSAAIAVLVGAAVWSACHFTSTWATLGSLALASAIGVSVFAVAVIYALPGIWNTVLNQFVRRRAG